MSRFFIRRPIVAIVIAIITVLGGMVALSGLPISQFPQIVPPQITVTAQYPGADALTIEQSVATPLEQQMNGVDNMLYMLSTNANDGTMALTVTFDVDTDPNIDQVNVQNRMAQAQPNLPPEVSQFGLTMRKQTGLPMLIVSLMSPNKTYDALFLANYANINVLDALYRVPGVGEARIFGAGDYSMRIWVQPDLMARLGLTVPDLSRAIQQQSTVNPSGQVGANPAPSGQDMTYTVRSQGRLQTEAEFGNIAVRSNPDGSVIRLRDVARIELGALNYQQIGRVNGQPGCAIAVFQAPGSNALDVAEGVRKQMTELQARFPADLTYAYTLDTTTAVSQGIREIIITLSEAMVLVVLVVYLFLQNWRATLIPVVAVPVSLIGTFMIFPALGFSVNTLSLFGLVLAIGLVVDDAIVVVEAVEHHIEEGMSPKDATLRAMEEVSGPVVSIALILASVFIPVAFMGGIQGSLNKQFAITIAISVLISAFNALTLSPALAAMWLRPRKPGRFLGGFFTLFNRGFEKASDGYISVSRALIRKAAIGIALLAGFAILAGGLGRRLPTSFVPEEDYGYFLLNVALPPAASLQRTDDVCRKVEAVLAKTEGLSAFNAIIGFSLLTRVTAPNNGFYFVGLKKWSERGEGMDARSIVNRLNTQFRQTIPEATVLVVMPPAIPGLGSQGGFTFWLQDRTGGTIEGLDATLQKFLAEARKRPEVAGISSPFSAAVPQVFVDVDRDKVLKEGIALTDVYQTMQTFLGGLYVNQFNRFGRQWRVFMQAEGQERISPDSIGQFYVRNNDGNMVPMSSLQSTRQTFGPQYTNRFNVYRAAQITGAAAPGYSSGQALDALESVAKATLPSTVSYDWSDLSYQERKASGNSSRVFGLSIVFVFLILAALYESWSLPFSVLLSVPIAVVGAFAGLLMRKFDFDVYAQVGVVMLIGLAAKNAILIVEFAKLRREEGKDPVTAALEGARLRLRPILMTSFAFILGCVPLWTAEGSGAASRRILGTVVISGMLTATLLAIFLIPMLYVQVEKLGELAIAFARRGHDAGAGVERLMMRTLLITSSLASSVLLAGCLVGPDYEKPKLPVPEAVRGAETATAGPGFADERWWDVFQDEQLQGLVKTALQQNENVQIAAARVLQAEAQLGITRADQYPGVDVNGLAGGGRTAEQGSTAARNAAALRVGGSLSWELDFWGRLRRATESARAVVLGTEWGRRAVLTTVVSQVADAYFSLRALDDQLEIARRTLASRQESLQLTRVRESGGVTSLLDVREAEQLVAGAGAAIADLERRIAQQENFISILLGNFPGAIARGRRLTDQPHAPEVAAGLPSSLLERRPDVQAAEQQIVSANAEIGVARANYFPSITLTGDGGLQSAALGALFGAGAGFWNVAVAAAQPVFTAGRTRSQVALAEARTHEATLLYSQTVKGAFREASDAIVGYSKTREFRAQQETLTTAAQDARRLADIRYQGGATSYLEVLDADTRLFNAEIDLANARLSELSAFVELYRALGGGWQQEGAPPQ